jgi:sugar phosphate isomerase/epimerase
MRVGRKGLKNQGADVPVRVGLTVQKYQGMDTSFILSLAKRFGLEYVELTQDVFEELDSVKKLVRRIKVGFHLPIICENGWDFSCTQELPKTEALIQQLKLHWQTLNIKYFLSHPPEPKETKTRIETSEELLFANLRRLPTHIFIENVPSWEPDEFEAFYERAKTALGKQLSGICLDAPHYFITGKDPQKFIRYWNKQIKLVHLSDCIEGHDLHLPFSSGGNLPIDAILQTLKELGYNQYINLELLPKTFNDLPYVIYSYLKVLKKFRPVKYYRSKFIVSIFLPFLRRLLNRS